ncbi:tetratricopeptide repeat protein [Pseudomonas sp. CAM1A]|uniref:tetratricopeptide repeat protein n=1 Tax=Pseudomonas sp. CAM1A TaxID=3231717 RepID=UPI0039C725D1
MPPCRSRCRLESTAKNNLQDFQHLFNYFEDFDLFCAEFNIESPVFTCELIEVDSNFSCSSLLKAALGDPYAYAELGRMARDGVDAPADFAKAREYYKMAGPAGVVGLGKLMEQGKGGPEDVQGALDLYMATTQKHLDPAWMAMRPLLAAGFPLDAGQVKKYNRLWTKGLWALQGKWLNRRTSFNGVDRSVQLTVKVLYRFPAGRTRPDAYLTQSSGNLQADAVVVNALDKLPMDDPYLTPFGQPTPDIVASVVLMPVVDKPTMRAAQ